MVARSWPLASEVASSWRRSSRRWVQRGPRSNHLPVSFPCRHGRWCGPGGLGHAPESTDRHLHRRGHGRTGGGASDPRRKLGSHPGLDRHHPGHGFVQYPVVRGVGSSQTWNGRAVGNGKDASRRRIVRMDHAAPFLRRSMHKLHRTSGGRCTFPVRGSGALWPWRP